MTVEYQKVWTTMNDLELVTSKICSAREIIDSAIDRIQEHQYDKAEMMMSAAYEYLEYYLQEFDDKFKLAWQATVGDLRDGDKEAHNAVMQEREYYEPSMPPWGHSDLEYGIHYTEEELNAMCDKAASDDEKEKCREYNMREAEYYDKRAKLDIEHSKYYYDYDRNDLNRPNPFLDEEKKWVLPISELGELCFVSLPDDLLKAANLKEGDNVEWIDNKDGSYTLKKS